MARQPDMDADMSEIKRSKNVEDVSEQILRNHYPLHLACRNGDVENVKALLLSGQYDIYEEDGLRGWTPTHWAASAGHLKCLMLLCELDASPDVPTLRFNQTPAHIAAQHGSFLCLKWLMHCGAACNRQDHLGDTPLHKAAQSGSLECIMVLVSHGPALSLKNHRGYTPLEVALNAKKDDCAKYLDRALAVQQGQSHVFPNQCSPILMNGEPIYMCQTNLVVPLIKSTFEHEEMETGDGNNSTYSRADNEATHMAQTGVKRSLDEDSTSMLKRQRCFEPSVIDRFGTTDNNNVLSSYNAVLAMPTETKRDYRVQMNEEQQASITSLSQNCSSFASSASEQELLFTGLSSMMEHCQSLQAQYGYDNVVIDSIIRLQHGN